MTTKRKTHHQAMKSILIVEDDITYSLMLKTWLGKKGFKASTASNVARARKHLETEKVDLVLSDLRLPDHDGTDLLRWLADKDYDVPLIIMTGYADIQTAVQAMKLGASDYVAKPVNPDELLRKIGEALSANSPAADTPRHKDTAHETTDTDFLEGESDAAKQLFNYVRLVAPTNMSVLINGASGTGKEYVAHRIHRLSKRAQQPFIAIDCGAIPKELAASEIALKGIAEMEFILEQIERVPMNAKLELENTELTYQDVEMETLGDLALLFNTYENNLLMVDFESESADVAAENLESALASYKIGSLSGIEFREYQDSYLEAVNRKLSALYEAKVSELSLLLISGNIRASMESAGE